MRTKKLLMLAGEADNLRLAITKAFPNKNLRLTYPKCVWFIHRVLSEKIYNQERYDLDGAEINTKQLPDIISVDHSTGCKLLNFMVDQRYIVRHSSHFYFATENGIRGNCATYKLHPRFELNNTQVCYKTFKEGEHTFIKNMLAFEDGERSRKPEVYQTRVLLRNNLRISPEGLTYLNNKYNGSYQDHEIGDSVLIAIAEKNFSCKREDSGRLFSTFCNLKRIHRPYILMDSEPIHSIDMANAQVLFCFIPILQFFKELGVTVPADVSECVDHASKGRFYRVMMEKLGLPYNEEEKDTFKKRFFKEVMFTRNPNYSSKLRTMLNTHYPNLWGAFKTVKKRIEDTNQISYAKYLQQIEAGIFIETFLQLSEEGHRLLTLHDAIYSNDFDTLLEAEETVRTMMKEKYNLDVTMARSFTQWEYEMWDSFNEMLFGKDYKTRFTRDRYFVDAEMKERITAQLELELSQEKKPLRIKEPKRRLKIKKRPMVKG